MEQVHSLVDRGLTKEILSKLVIEGDESDQSSILGTVYMSKKKLLVIQTKIWNGQPYWDFRTWYMNDEGNFLPTKKGFMLASSHKKSDGTDVYPIQDLLKTLTLISNMPNEGDAELVALKTSGLTTDLLQGILDRNPELTNEQKALYPADKRIVNQFIHNPIDNEFVGP